MREDTGRRRWWLEPPKLSLLPAFCRRNRACRAEFAAAILLTLAALAAGLSVAHAMANAAVSPERAKVLTEFVRQDCGSCHGMTLKGGLGRPLSQNELAGRDAETIATIILDGIPDTAMPPWRPLLSEAEAHWIATALKEGRIK